MNFFDPTTFYTLHEAFYRTGRAMFGSAWQGFEVWSKPEGDPAELARERKLKLKKLETLKAEILTHYDKTSHLYKTDEQDAAHKALEPLYMEQHKLQE